MMIEAYMTWNTSRSHCTSLGADLPSIHNERVHSAVVDRFDFGWIWIGMPFIFYLKLNKGVF